MCAVADASLVLEPKPAAVGEARRWLSQQLAEWELHGVDYDLSVVASELVTNAVLHARTPFTLRLSYDKGAVRIEVEDSNPQLPVQRHRSPRATTGRGLVLVEALSSSWGCQRAGEGKIVWAEFSEVDAFAAGGELTRLRPSTGSGRRGGGGAGGGHGETALRADARSWRVIQGERAS